MRVVTGDFSVYISSEHRKVNGYKSVLSFDLTSWSLGGLEFIRHDDGKYEQVILRFLFIVLYINRFMGY